MFFFLRFIYFFFFWFLFLVIFSDFINSVANIALHNKNGRPARYNIDYFMRVRAKSDNRDRCTYNYACITCAHYTRYESTVSSRGEKRPRG